MYRAKWDRDRISFAEMKMRGGVEEDNLLGTLDFEESKRNIVFRNVNRLSEEEWEAVRVRKKKFGHIFMWLKRMLVRRNV